MDISFGDIFTGASFVGTVAVALLSTRFVPKADFEKEQTKREQLEKDMAELRTKTALAEQPVAQMAADIKSINEKMERFLLAHQDMESRLVRLEVERDAKKQTS